MTRSRSPGPTFNVRRLGENRPVQLRLRMPHLYEFGAHTSCGCGFLREDDDESREVEATAASRAALRSYVEDALATGRVELLVCWIGDEDKPADSFNLSPAELEDADFSQIWHRPLRLSVRL